MSESLYAITVTLEQYDPADDPDETEAQWKATQHRHLVIEAPMPTSGQHTEEAIRTSRRYCAGVLARVAVELSDDIAHVATRDDYKHRCDPHDGYWPYFPCGVHHHEGVVASWPSGEPYVQVVVATCYARFWLDRAIEATNRVLVSDADALDPTTDTHDDSAVPQLHTTEKTRAKP